MLLQIGRRCVNRPVSTDTRRRRRLTHQQILRLMEVLLVRRQISEVKSQYLQYGTSGSPSTVSTANVTENVTSKLCAVNYIKRWLMEYGTSLKINENKCRRFIVHYASLTCNSTRPQHTLQSTYQSVHFTSHRWQPNCF